MNITFDLQELSQLLSKALGCLVVAEHIHFTDEECVTITDVSVETITKAAQATQTAPQPSPYLHAEKLPVPKYFEAPQEEPKTDTADNFDEVMKVSQQLAQLLPEESKDFPADFMQGILDKIR
jgi:hypothetical protein